MISYPICKRRGEKGGECAPASAPASSALEIKHKVKPKQLCFAPLRSLHSLSSRHPRLVLSRFLAIAPIYHQTWYSGLAGASAPPVLSFSFACLVCDRIEREGAGEVSSAQAHAHQYLRMHMRMHTRMHTHQAHARAQARKRAGQRPSYSRLARVRF